MTILGELLKEIKSDNNLEKIRILCDRIFEEEKENIKHIEVMPTGPNIFLTLEVPGRIKDEIAFLSLERESEDLYLSVLFIINRKEFKKSKGNEISIKRQRVWQIHDSRPEQILTGYAKRYKFLRGE